MLLSHVAEADPEWFVLVRDKNSGMHGRSVLFSAVSSNRGHAHHKFDLLTPLCYVTTEAIYKDIILH
jgi:hypothetical protein